MSQTATIGLSSHLTHKANLKQTRYGWLRLTPAYSVHLVSDLLNQHSEKSPTVLDPFCGTGTTALVCAERGIESTTTDINPFLLWLSQAKSRSYLPDEVCDFIEASAVVTASMKDTHQTTEWVPPLYQIEKWWDDHTIGSLSRALAAIHTQSHSYSQPVIDLLKLAFCRTLIQCAQVSFGHQSMSFKKHDSTLRLPLLSAHETAAGWNQAVREIAASAHSTIQTPPKILCGDARQLTEQFPANSFSCVITSPPYPNRMSYIRELRPYMYWLGYLQKASDASDLDWQAIGGTWGSATSKVGKWEPDEQREIPYPDFHPILARIAETSPLLARYVHKYFFDMVRHCRELSAVVRAGGEIHYIVGNSKFYDVMLPVEEIFAAMFASVGLTRITIKTIRKRTSKKELFEFTVSAQKPY